jgi:hypothetical protein
MQARHLIQPFCSTSCDAPQHEPPLTTIDEVTCGQSLQTAVAAWGSRPHRLQTPGIISGRILMQLAGFSFILVLIISVDYELQDKII